MEAALSAAAAAAAGLRPCKVTLKGAGKSWGYSVVAEHVPSVCEALGPIFSTTKTKKVKKYIGGRASSQLISLSCQAPHRYRKGVLWTQGLTRTTTCRLDKNTLRPDGGGARL